MSIISMNRVSVGSVGVEPGTVDIVSTDNLATVTAAGYISAFNNSVGLTNLDIVRMFYSYDVNTNEGTFAMFTVLVSGTTITLTEWVNTGDVLLPVTSGDFAVFNGTNGQIKDAGYSPSNASKTKVVMASAAVVTNRIACFSDTAGTVNDDAAIAINGGDIQAGLSGTPGSLGSFPSTASKGSLVIEAADNVGDTITTITNASFLQTSTLTIPDPVDATAAFLVAPSALVNNNLIKASGTLGLAADAGFRIIANVTGTYAGGGTSNTFAATGLTSSCHGSAVIRTSTNAVAIAKAVPGTDTLAITFTADPGASTTVDYIYSTTAV